MENRSNVDTGFDEKGYIDIIQFSDSHYSICVKRCHDCNVWYIYTLRIGSGTETREHKCKVIK